VPPSFGTSLPPGGIELGSKPRKRWVWWLVGGAVVLVIVGGLASRYGSELGARVRPGASFRITGPDTLVAGSTAVVTWDLSPENQQQYPTEKIELCQGSLFGQRCTVLAGSTANDGEAAVAVPATLKKGKAYLRLTARSQDGRQVLASRSAAIPVTIDSSGTPAGVIRPAEVGGNVLPLTGPTGPRLKIAAGQKYTVVLPGPGVTRKIELCQTVRGSERCQILAAKASGKQASVTIPRSYTSGKGHIKVSERRPDGSVGGVLYRRAVEVGKPVEEGGSGGDSGGGGGGGGGGDSGGGSGGGGRKVKAQFIVPANNDDLTAGVALDVRVRLDGVTLQDLGCQEWLLDNQQILPEQWVEGQSPDLSSGSCI
jgi:uncharacterized membrane protein YgcG